MKIPKGYTEEQVVEIIEKISRRLANKFKFGYHEVDDMKQQAALFAWEGLENYDNVRPLENFLWVHVHNRLYNFKRNNFSRLDKPCLNCPLNAYINNQCTLYKDLNDCEYYAKWNERNEIKKSLMSTKEHQEVIDIRESQSDQVDYKEILDLIDKNIPLSMREDWIRYSHKLKLSKTKRTNLTNLIIIILKEYGIDSQTWETL